MASSRMLALLGLLAIAGYQNRDKLAEMLGRVTNSKGPNPNQPVNATPTNGLGGVLGNLGGLLGGAAGAGLSGTLGDLVDSFTKSGQGDTARSWVTTGTNQDLTASQLKSALGEDGIEQLMGQTGLSREELLSRLQAVLPTAIDKLTPEGRLPTNEEAQRWAAS